MSIRGYTVYPLILLALCGCATSQQPPASHTRTAVATTDAIRSKLIGTWQYEYNGVTVEVTYTPTTFTLAGITPTPYTLNGNEITVDVLGAKTSVIEFHGNDEMTQTNKTDGQRYVFKRKPKT